MDHLYAAMLEAHALIICLFLDHLVELTRNKCLFPDCKPSFATLNDAQTLTLSLRNILGCTKQTKKSLDFRMSVQDHHTSIHNRGESIKMLHVENKARANVTELIMFLETQKQAKQSNNE